MRARPRLARAFRIASLVVPSWGAWYVVFTTKHADELVRTVGLALGPLWGVLVAVLALRLAALAVRGRREPGPLLAQVDVLTGSGVALAWSSALALVLAAKIGFASVAVVGLLGTAVLHLAVLYTLLVVRGADPVRASRITRRFSPDVVTEGDPLVEELRFDGVRIPIGFRMFVTGHIVPRWPTTRHVLETTDSGAEVVLEAELGAALRGEHGTEPLRVWLEDVLGLCRSAFVDVGAGHLSVLPRVAEVDEIAPLLERGDGPRAPRATPRLPTEGLFDLREYQQGDDVRRIHWVRSLAAGELVVRMPDEVPPDRPEVRLVLDTYFPEALVVSCDATAALLDALVSAWLGVARRLAESGVRVKLVAAVARDAHDDDVTAVRLDFARRDVARAQRLGASVAWQARVPVEELLTDEATIVVTRGVRSAAPADAGERTQPLRWILVAHEVAHEGWKEPSVARHPYPMGSRENRWSRRRRFAEERWQAGLDHGRAVIAMRKGLVEPPAGSLLLRARGDGSAHLERLA